VHRLILKATPYNVSSEDKEGKEDEDKKIEMEPFSSLYSV